MRGRGWLGTLLLVVLVAVVAGPWSPAPRVHAEDEKAVKKKMQGWSRDLGVKCSYCHVQQGRTYDYEADTPKKLIAHHCDDHFVKKLQLDGRPVTCADCHQRKARFFPREGEEAAPPPAPEDEKKEEEEKKE